ncbi:MAG: 3-deoxy-D-manno-octulosonic acid transferase [Flavobacteriales bacterium]|nr:3-deoxy-D-manno-octulosonic acid transferase [Flavobacteriales bacterium]
MPFLYDAGTGLYHTAIKLAAPWKPKAAAWLKGREGLWQRLEAKREQLQGCLWMHCASVGEFEQGRPVLEAIKKERPELPVLLTFFSPSGYEARKDFPLAMHVEYLPPDSKANARKLQELVRPKAAIFVKYEFWYHHLQALREAGTPTFLVSAVFRKDQPFFRWYGGAWRRMVKSFTQIFTQDQHSMDLLAGLGLRNVSVGGDTRFDRVAAIVADREEIPLAKAFAGAAQLLICGSTWPEDERLLAEALVGMGKAAPKCMVVPHELHEEQLEATEKRFPKPLARWSQLENSEPANIASTLGIEPQGTLLVDRMGLLARLYRYGSVAYVGGGFTDGIHSILEAAAWGVPVIFGPEHKKFPEAQGLIDAGAGVAVTNAAELKSALDKWLGNAETLEKASAAARHFVQERKGAADAVARAVLSAL